MRWSRLALKIGFVIIVLLNVYDMYQYSKDDYNTYNTEVKPIHSGVYEVAIFAVNKDTIPPLISDTVRWQDVIIDPGGMGSIKTTDTAFRQRYRRAYFVFTADTVHQQLQLKKLRQDSLPFLSCITSCRIPTSYNCWVKKVMIHCM